MTADRGRRCDGAPSGSSSPTVQGPKALCGTLAPQVRECRGGSRATSSSVIISRPRRPFPPTQHQFAFAGSVDHRHGLCHELIGPAGRALLVALRLEHDAFPGSLRGVSELLQRMKRGVEHGARQIHARPFARLPLLEQPFVRQFADGAAGRTLVEPVFLDVMRMDQWARPRGGGPTAPRRPSGRAVSLGRRFHQCFGHGRSP